MQDTSPAANQRPDPAGGRAADGAVRVAVTWMEYGVDEPVDTPLIVLLPLPDPP